MKTRGGPASFVNNFKLQNLSRRCERKSLVEKKRKLCAGLSLAAAAFLLLAACTGAKSQWPVITSASIDLSHIDHPAVMLAGDSNFQRWPIKQIGRYQVINAGVNGITAGGYYDFARAIAWSDVPDEIVLMLGTNDGEHLTTPVAAYATALRQDIAFLKGKAPVIVLGILPQESWRDPRLVAYNEAARAAAAAEGAPFKDLRPLFTKPGYTRDKTHLSAAGYEILLQAIAQQLP